MEGTRQTIGGTLKAAQCFSNAPDGRAICMVWARVKPQDPQAPYNQGFTLPLELSLRTATDGVRCYTNPVKEVAALRQCELANVQNKVVEGEIRIPLEKPATLLEIDLSFRYGDGKRSETMRGIPRRSCLRMRSLRDSFPSSSASTPMPWRWR